MKRGKEVPSSEGKKAKTTLLSWLKHLKKSVEEHYHGGVAVELGDKTEVVDILIKPSMFDESIPFGVYCSTEMIYVAPSDTNMHNAFIKLVAGEESEFYNNDNKYVTFQQNGKMYQRNVLTGMRREIIPSPIGEGIKMWFNKYGGGIEERELGIRIQLVFDAKTFPNTPPFCYVKEPRIKQWSGHITNGGSFCSKLFTTGDGDGNDGAWFSTIEPKYLVDQLYACLINYGKLNGEGRYLGALRIDMHGKHPYNEKDAREAHGAACTVHKWKTN